MPECKNCHRTISSFDNDVCPYCGERNPIDHNYKTKDITQFVDPITGDYKLYKSKSKKTMAFLMLGLGMFGVPYFYIGKWQRGLAELVISLVLIAGLGSVLFFTCLANAFAYLIPFFVLLVFYALMSIRVYKSETIKDAHGEFLR